MSSNLQELTNSGDQEAFMRHSNVVSSCFDIFDICMGLYQLQDYKQSFTCFFLACNGEHKGSALYHLATHHFQGLGTSVNQGKGLELLKQSAECGHTNAMIALGGFSRLIGDMKQSMQWYDLAVSLGSSEAMFWIGYSYYQEWVKLDPSKRVMSHPSFLLGMQNLRSTADAGCPKAHHVLAMNALQHGVQKDVPKAIEHLKSSDSENSNLVLGQLYSSGLYGVAVDRPLALQYFMKAGPKGQDYILKTVRSILSDAFLAKPIAFFELAYCMHFGIGMQRSQEAAVKYYSLAGESGIPNAYTAAGNLLLQSDPLAAIELFKKGELQGDAFSTNGIAIARHMFGFNETEATPQQDDDSSQQIFDSFFNLDGIEEATINNDDWLNIE